MRNLYSWPDKTVEKEREGERDLERRKKMRRKKSVTNATPSGCFLTGLDYESRQQVRDTKDKSVRQRSIRVIRFAFSGIYEFLDEQHICT